MGRATASARGCILLAAAIALGGVLGVTPATSQVAVTPEVPLTVWSSALPGGVPGLTGVGGWLATVNVPAAGAGQAAPEYDYFHEFYFQNSNSYGHVSLLVQGTTRSAGLAIVDEEEGRTHRVTVRFPWLANRFYFPIVTKTADGIWTGHIFDATAQQWTTIGSLLVPPRLSLLDPVTATGIAWIGPDLPACSAFPLADLFRMTPVGLAESTTIPQVAEQRDKVPGTCPTTILPGSPPGFDRYVVGSPPVTGAAQAQQQSPAPTGDVVRYRR